jgi:hypothetical protein
MSDQPPEDANDSEKRSRLEERPLHLRAFAIAFGALNALAAAAAIFGAIVYVSEADARRLQRDTFHALAVEMLFARLDRARGSYVNSSDVLRRLNAFGVHLRDVDLSRLVLVDPPEKPDTREYLRGNGYFIACPIGDDGVLEVYGPGRVLGCGASRAFFDVANPVQLEMAAAHLTEPTFYCRAGSNVHFIVDSQLVRPTFNCKRDQVSFLRGSQEPEDARWCHPDDFPSRTEAGGKLVYASGPCEGERYPDFLGKNEELLMTR